MKLSKKLFYLFLPVVLGGLVGFIISGKFKSDKEIEEQYGRCAKALVESAKKHVQILESLDFYNSLLFKFILFINIIRL